MALVDPEGARRQIIRFLELIPQIRSLEEAWEGRFTDPRKGPLPEQEFGTYGEFVRWLNSTVFGLQALMEYIAKEVDPSANRSAFKEDLISGWDPAEKAAWRLLGILDNQDEWERILGPQGPVLAAGGLHPWVWNAAVNLWDGGHYKQAVHAAWNAVEQQTRLKLDRGNLSGKDLYAQAFSTKSGRRLRFSRIRQETDDGKTIPEWISAHEGAMYFGMGCAQGIRNLQAHGTEHLDEQEALEYVAALSVLARWVDTADVDHNS